MNLILWRHAEAENGGPNLPDVARQLTKNGRDQATRVANWLSSHMPDQALIVASSSVRTRQTADALGCAYVQEDRLYESCVEDYLAVIQAQRAHETLVLVGHQPVLGELASHLLNGRAQPWAFEKGAVWWLRGYALDQPGAIELVTVISPALL